ncbi:MAG TPA: hypothetical protein VLG69_00190 [Candidatus Andersenbacteria bacterium]|nr:hypothetical protein [Candidatus Andersenbacteria bacterium]
MMRYPIYHPKNNYLAIAQAGLVILYFLPNIPRSLELIIGALIVIATIFSIATIITFFCNQAFDFFESVSVGIAGMLTILPALVYGIYSLTHALEPRILQYLIATLFLISIILRTHSHPLLSTENGNKADTYLFWVMFIIFGGIISMLVFWYQALPDLDPYGWIQTLEPKFRSHTLPEITERPFFGLLTYVFISLLHIDIFTFFKYVLPYLATLLLFPLWVVIRNMTSVACKGLLLLYFLAVPSTMLYMTTATPYAILLLLTAYACMFVIHSKNANKSFFYFFAGFLFLIAFLYHQAASIFFGTWCLVTLIAYRKVLFFSPKNLAIFVLALLLFRNSLLLIINFVGYWVRSAYSQIFNAHNINLLYPAQYVNIDGNQMGWPGMFGVAKFYLYYASPLVLFAIALLSVACISKKKSIPRFVCSKENALVMLLFFIFLVIAEVLPRFPNIALLPERAWNFVSIFTLALLILAMQSRHKPRNVKTIMIIATTFLLVGITGTLYVNSLKAFLITPQQIQSAAWIRSNLPPNRVIFGYNNNNLILYHAKSQYIDFKENIFCKNLSINEVGYRINSSAYAHKDIQGSRTEFEKAKGIPATRVQEPTVPPNTIIYIYFAPKDDRNPYSNRGYHPEYWGGDACGENGYLFDKYPEKFQRIYDQNGIIIWQYI